FPIGPLIVTWAPGTVAFVASRTTPLILPRAELWSCAHVALPKSKGKTRRAAKQANHFAFFNAILLSIPPMDSNEEILLRPRKMQPNRVGWDRCKGNAKAACKLPPGIHLK